MGSGKIEHDNLGIIQGQKGGRRWNVSMQITGGS